MPKHTQIGDNIIEIDGKYRIEPGPRRRRANATAQLLHNDRTAPGYAEGKLDAAGQIIKVGQPMVFLEYGGEAHPPEIWFFLYELQMETGDPRWVEVGSYPELDEAISRADSLVAA